DSFVTLGIPVVRLTVSLRCAAHSQRLNDRPYCGSSASGTDALSQRSTSNQHLSEAPRDVTAVAAVANADDGRSSIVSTTACLALVSESRARGVKDHRGRGNRRREHSRIVGRQRLRWQSHCGYDPRLYA